MERLPKHNLAAADAGIDRRQVEEDGAVSQVGPPHELFDPVQDHRALEVERGPFAAVNEAGPTKAPPVASMQRPSDSQWGNVPNWS